MALVPPPIPFIRLLEKDVYYVYHGKITPRYLFSWHWVPSLGIILGIDNPYFYPNTHGCVGPQKFISTLQNVKTMDSFLPQFLESYFPTPTSTTTWTYQKYQKILELLPPDYIIWRNRFSRYLQKAYKEGYLQLLDHRFGDELGYVKSIQSAAKIFQDAATMWEQKKHYWRTRPLSWRYYLIGPVSLQTFSYKNKNIILLGETHGGTQFACPSGMDMDVDGFLISEWLFLMSKYCEGEFDFYLEASFSTRQEYDYKKQAKQKPQPRSNDYIDDILDFFHESFQPDKSKCIYKGPHTRFHYVDVRRTGNFKYLDLMYEALDNIRDEYNVSESVKILDKSLKKLKQISQQDLFTPPKLDRYLNTMDPALRKKFVEYFDSQLQTFQLQAKDIIPTLEEILKELSQNENPLADGETKYNDFTSDLLNIGAYYMDLYTMGRIFRSSKPSNTPQWVIIYAGADHIDNYASFLNYIGARKRIGLTSQSQDQGQSQDQRCIDLTGIPSNLFSSAKKKNTGLLPDPR